MNIEPANLLLLADIETVFFFIILFFSFIGWIGKLLKGVKDKQPPALGGRGQQRAAGGKDPHLQQEIDRFLEDVLGDDQAQRVKQKQSKAEQRRQQSERKRKAEERRRQEQQRKTAPSAERLEPKRSGVSDHVNTYMESQVGDHVESHLTHLDSTVDDSVISHFGSSAIQPAGTSSPPGHTIASNVFDMLSTPTGIAQAVIANEILSAPISRRR